MTLKIIFEPLDQKTLIFSTLGNLFQGPNDMREPQHESLIEITNAQEVVKRC